MSVEKYNDDNVFAKILRGDLPTKKVFENDELLCFCDQNPVSRIHVLIIPKGKYINYTDFVSNAPADFVARFFKTIPEIAKQLGVNEYRIVSNCGESAGQIIFHFHVHLIAK